MRTRFAPSPTGPLHLGHAWSAWTAEDLARREGGDFLLRIEDIDRQRSKPEWEDALKRDLDWLGIEWTGRVWRQSERLDAYARALDGLWARGLLYPCDCTRRDIAAALSAPQEGAQMGPDGPVYPGTCRGKPRTGPRPTDLHLRLDARAAWGTLRFETLGFRETGPDRAGEIPVEPATFMEEIGDVVLARRDFGTSYHLSVVADDAFQEITHVARGVDLFEATAIHVLLLRLMALPVPTYHHHDLVRDATGKRLAKRDDARAVAAYREAGWTPEALRARLEESLTAPDP